MENGEGSRKFSNLTNGLINSHSFNTWAAPACHEASKAPCKSKVKTINKVSIQLPLTEKPSLSPHYTQHALLQPQLSSYGR